MAVNQVSHKNMYEAKDLLNRSFDGDKNMIIVEPTVYNPVTGGMDRVVGMDESYIKIDSADPSDQYVGLNANFSALDGDSTWLIYHIEPSQIKRATGSWTDRSSLF